MCAQGIETRDAPPMGCGEEGCAGKSGLTCTFARDAVGCLVAPVGRAAVVPSPSPLELAPGRDVSGGKGRHLAGPAVPERGWSPDFWLPKHRGQTPAAEVGCGSSAVSALCCGSCGRGLPDWVPGYTADGSHDGISGGPFPTACWLDSSRVAAQQWCWSVALSDGLVTRTGHALLSHSPCLVLPTLPEISLKRRQT